MDNNKEQPKGSGHALYIYPVTQHQARCEQRCGAVARPLSCTVPTCSSPEMPGHAPGEGLLQGLLLRWMGLHPAPSSNAGLATRPQGWDNRLCMGWGGSPEVLRTPRVKGLVAGRQLRGSGVPPSCGGARSCSVHWFRHRQSPATRQHSVFGTTSLRAAASHTCTQNLPVAAARWSASRDGPRRS